MSAAPQPRPYVGGRTRAASVPLTRALTAALLAACSGGSPQPAPAANGAAGRVAGGATAGAAGAANPAGGVGQPVNPTSLNPGASLRRDTTGAPYDATAADSVERQVAARATGETSPAVTGGNSGMQLPANVPVSQVGAGPTVTQRDAGGDQYRGGRGAAASAFIGTDGRAYYTDAAGRVMSDAEVRGRSVEPAVAAGDNRIATGSVAAYQPNAADAPGAAARNGSPLAAAPGTQSGATSALSAAGAVGRTVAWGGASPEVAAKLQRGTRVAPVAPALRDSASPASPGGPVNPAVSNAVLAPSAANARAVLTLINASQIEAARLAEQRASTPALRQFAATLRRDHEAQAAALERAGEAFRMAALTAPQRQAIGQALAEQRATLGALQQGAPNFDTQWISAQVAAHEKALADLRALGPVVAQPALQAYVARLTMGVEGHLREAQRLQTRPGASAPGGR